jgi:hypothetical protein
LYDVADDVDGILRRAGFMDTIKQWISGKPMPKCTCGCEQCVYARDAVGKPAVQAEHHQKCSQGKCEVLTHLKQVG